ncbi:MAG: Ig-like domain-containing protein [Vicinamibacterales bacterium]
MPEFTPVGGLDPSLTTPETVNAGGGGTNVVGVSAVGAEGPLANAGGSCCAQADKPKSRQMKIARFFLAMAVSCIVTSCSPSFPSQPSAPAELASIVVHYPVLGFRSSTTTAVQQFEAYAVDTDGVYLRITNQVTWASSDPSRLVPSATRAGAVSIGTAGNAVLLVIYQGFQSDLPIEIRSPSVPRLQIQTPAVEGLSVSVAVVTAGGTQTVANTTAAWTSGDESIATVDVGGKVTGHRPGNVRIRATRDGLSDFYWMSVPPRSK